MKRIGVLLAAVAVCLGASRAEAVPLLQLDMQNGAYDPVTETIFAPNGDFTLYALLTPKEGASSAQIAALLSDTYYVSVAITPQLKLTDDGLGSFTFGQVGRSTQTVDVTDDMAFGTPPVDLYMGFDSGDLSKHSIFPTYYYQYAFKFSATNTTLAYNTANDPGGPSGSPGTAYYATFTGSSSNLASGYDLHFDLYDTELNLCIISKLCLDVDVDHFAPFSHDAETSSVPEPATVLLMGAGMAGLAAWRRKKSQA